MSSPYQAPASRPGTLAEALDSLLETGAVVDGQLVISVAGVDLVFIGLRALLAATDTAARLMSPAMPQVDR